MQLVIAEKPSVAKSIAKVIGATTNKDGYVEGNGYIVSWCVGHLIELNSPECYHEEWKKWSYSTLPMIPEIWQYNVKHETAAQYKVLEKLMNLSSVESVVCATDAGREGELIFRLVYNYAKCKKPIMRLWISSMEESAIRDGFKNLKPGSDYDNLYKSALCRQEADWLVGMNGTRLFTVVYGGGKVLKVGRVQTPTLSMLVERENAISNFVKEPYYKVSILAGDVESIGERIDNKAEAERIAELCKGKIARVSSVKKEIKTEAQPKLYDLTTLQRDANRIFGLTAKQTLEYTQSLYEKKLCTYPRTDSRYLSDDMEQTAANVLKAISDANIFTPVQFTPDIKRTLNSSKVTDHHAIIPTVEIASADMTSLSEGEKKILYLLANRLQCSTGEKHEYESVKIEFTCEGNVFTAFGKTVLRNGWKELEASFRRSISAVESEKTEESKELPRLSEGESFNVVKAQISELTTQPPKHFSEDSLLAAMEKAGAEEMNDEVERKGLGTPATRADIIEKLVKDGFVKREKKQMLPTTEGINLISILPEAVKSPKLTADWENSLTLVAKGEYSMQEFMRGIEGMVKELVKSCNSVSDDAKKMFGGTADVLGKCPNCNGDVVKGKYGVYCKNKCGMSLGRAMGKVLTDTQVKNLLEGKKTLLKGLKGKNGEYDAYLTPNGIEDYSYTSSDGKKISGKQFKFTMDFPKKKK